VRYCGGTYGLIRVRPDLRKLRLARLRQAATACRSIQQTYAEARFQLADGLTERRGRYLQLGRCRRESAMLGHLPEGHQTVELIEFHILKYSFT